MWTSVVIGLMALSLLSGCAPGPEGTQSPSGNYVVQGGKWAPAAQALSKMQAPDPNRELQQQLMVQASQAALVNYKDYQVGPEDQLDIVIFGQDNLNRELRVNGQGEIAMPLVGLVK